MAQPLPVPSATASLSGQGERYTLDGVVQASRQSTVSAQASGRVTALLVKAGDRVRAGQLLVTIDAQEARLGVQRAQAQMAQADAELRDATAQVQRSRELQHKGYISPAALDMAEARYQSAVALHDQAAAGNQLAGVAAAYTHVSAPFDGWVQQTLVQAGDLAAPGVPLLVLYAPQSLRATVQVPASRNVFVRNARQTLVLADDPAAPPLVPIHRQEIPAADAQTQTSEWRLDLAAKDSAALKPGDPVRVTFADGAAPASPALSVVSVPLTAIVRRGELSAVYVHTDGGFVLRAVRLGNPVGADRVEITAGLSAGAVVALDPLRAVQPGATAQLVK